jgi:methylglutaconyl-CoA hydratase
MAEAVLYEVDEEGVAMITLNKPQIRNAFDEEMVDALQVAADRATEDAETRFVVVTGSQGVFSAGADLNWIKQMATGSTQANKSSGRKISAMLQAFYDIPKPTIARVEGAAFGGGCGLACALDFVVADENAKFAIPGTQLGLIPTAVTPYVIEAIGARAARQYLMTSETMTAEEAAELGLVWDVAYPGELDHAIEDLIRLLRNGSPQAQGNTKRLINEITHKPIDEELVEEIAAFTADMSGTEEAKEGVAAFLEKRRPFWQED